MTTVRAPPPYKTAIVPEGNPHALVIYIYIYGREIGKAVHGGTDHSAAISIQVHGLFENVSAVMFFGPCVCVCDHAQHLPRKPAC